MDGTILEIIVLLPIVGMFAIGLALAIVIVLRELKGG